VRLRRARDEAGLTVRQIEEVLFPHVSKSGVIRLEQRGEPPTFRKDRGRAALLVLLYGFELDDFDLTEADVPPAMDLGVIDRLGRRATIRNRCFRDGTGGPVLARAG
jgi:hypothetical protein